MEETFFPHEEIFTDFGQIHETFFHKISEALKHTPSV